MTREQMKESLESMLDRAPGGLKEILNLLAEICQEKADHLESNWQDRISAQGWMNVADKISELTDELI
jgi:ribosomal protein S15P/S13E